MRIRMNSFYQAALDIAEAKLFRDPAPTALLSPRLGTGGSFVDIFLWDTCFCSFWVQYHPASFYYAVTSGQRKLTSSQVKWSNSGMKRLHK